MCLEGLGSNSNVGEGEVVSYTSTQGGGGSLSVVCIRIFDHSCGQFLRSNILFVSIKFVVYVVIHT